MNKPKYDDDSDLFFLCVLVALAFIAIHWGLA